MDFADIAPIILFCKGAFVWFVTTEWQLVDGGCFEVNMVRSIEVFAISGRFPGNTSKRYITVNSDDSWDPEQNNRVPRRL